MIGVMVGVMLNSIDIWFISCCVLWLWYRLWIIVWLMIMLIFVDRFCSVWNVSSVVRLVDSV